MPGLHPAVDPEVVDFVPMVARGLAVLGAGGLRRGDLSLELGLSLWLRRTGTDPASAVVQLLELRDGVVEAARLDRASEPVPLLAGDSRQALLSLAVYALGLVGRAAAATGLSRDEVVELTLALRSLRSQEAAVR